MAQQLVEGWTERIKTQLLADGEVFDLTGYNTSPASVVMRLYGRNGSLITVTGSAGIDDAVNGIVYFDPGTNDLKASLSPYAVRWKVTDSDGKVAFFPNGDPEVWTVSSVSGA